MIDLTSLPDVTDAIVRVRIHATEEQWRRIDQRELEQHLYDAGAYLVAQIIPDVVRPQSARMTPAGDDDLTPAAIVALWASAEIKDAAQREEAVKLAARYLETA